MDLTKSNLYYLGRYWIVDCVPKIKFGLAEFILDIQCERVLQGVKICGGQSLHSHKVNGFGGDTYIDGFANHKSDLLIALFRN